MLQTFEVFQGPRGPRISILGLREIFDGLGQWIYGVVSLLFINQACMIRIFTYHSPDFHLRQSQICHPCTLVWWVCGQTQSPDPHLWESRMLTRLSLTMLTACQMGLFFIARHRSPANFDARFVDSNPGEMTLHMAKRQSASTLPETRCWADFTVNTGLNEVGDLWKVQLAAIAEWSAHKAPKHAAGVRFPDDACWQVKDKWERDKE